MEPPRLLPPQLGARFGHAGALGSGPQVLRVVSQPQNPAVGAAELLLELPWGASSKGCPHIREEEVGRRKSCPGDAVVHQRFWVGGDGALNDISWLSGGALGIWSKGCGYLEHPIVHGASPGSGEENTH